MSTELNRANLLTSLNLAKAAIANQAYVMALTHFCFDEESILAYNDISAISIRNQTELLLCLPAEMLIKALNSMVGEKAAVTQVDDGSVVLSCGRSKVKMPCLPVKDFPFEFPIPDWDDGFTLSQDLLRGIEKCLVGVGSDPTHPAQMGVTIESTKNGSVLYSTDNVTLSRYISDTEITLPGDSPIIMPTFFCQQLLALSKAFKDESVRIVSLGGALLANFGDQAMLYTKLLVDLEPMDFTKIIDRYLRGEDLKMQDIPVGFEAAMDRALLVMSNSMDKATTISVKDDKMRLFSTSDQGEATDTLALEHDDLEAFRVDPSLIARASKSCRSLAMLPKVMLMGDDGFIHMIAHC